MDIESFYPKYANISKFEDDILNPYDIGFYESIFRKKEFYEKKLDRIEDMPEKAGDLMKHQEIISRFLSSYTLYNGLLLMHSLGSGKSCSAVAVVERVLKENSSIKGCLILVRGDALRRAWIDQIVFVCTKGQYIPDDYENLNPNKQYIRKQASISKNYEIATYETFKNRFITKFKDEDENDVIRYAHPSIIRRLYSNKIIIIDEVHNLRIQPEKKEIREIYDFMHRFLHIIENKKVLILSGTPIWDRVEEISPILNLILPVNKQLPIGKDFVHKYLNREIGEGDNVMYSIKNIKKLKGYFFNIGIPLSISSI